MRITLVLPLLAACTLTPANGQAITGSVPGLSVGWIGYVGNPSESISVEVLNHPTDDPTVDGNWQPIAVGTVDPTPRYFNDPTPLYAWSANGIPAPVGVTGRWDTGGVVRTRAIGTDSSGTKITLTTFDQPTYSACISSLSQQNQSWQVIGSDCTGLGNGIVTLVSTDKTPLDLPASQKPDWLGKLGDISEQESFTYYNTWGAPPTLTSFRTTYGFNNTTDPTSTYYNDNDLGLGREMHCHAQATGVVACYVTNYSGIDNTPSFGNNPTTVLADAEAHQHEFATVAMVYTPTNNVVNFEVFNAEGARREVAQLDSTAKHTSVPNNCLTCHGVGTSYNQTTHTINGTAKFLPFDVAQFIYDTKPGYTRVDQEEGMRKLNALVLKTAPTLAITDFINGIYKPSSVTTVGAVANDTYIPSGWVSPSTQANQSAYLGIVKVGCRGCHMSAVDPKLDFLEASDWSSTSPVASSSRVRADVCSAIHTNTALNHVMPQAERTAYKFWKSGARGLLISGYPTNDQLDACTP
jgi:hypothetical protein